MLTNAVPIQLKEQNYKEYQQVQRTEYGAGNIHNLFVDIGSSLRISNPPLPSTYQSRPITTLKAKEYSAKIVASTPCHQIEIGSLPDIEESVTPSLVASQNVKDGFFLNCILSSHGKFPQNVLEASFCNNHSENYYLCCRIQPSKNPNGHSYLYECCPVSQENATSLTCVKSQYSEYPSTISQTPTNDEEQTGAENSYSQETTVESKNPSIKPSTVDNQKGESTKAPPLNDPSTLSNTGPSTGTKSNAPSNNPGATLVSLSSTLQLVLDQVQ